jgi:hypothetical protein
MTIKSGKMVLWSAAALLAMSLSTPAMAAKCGNNSSWLSSLDRTVQERSGPRRHFRKDNRPGIRQCALRQEDHLA